MNTETYQAEAAKSQQLSTFAISLIREHFDPSSENGFLELSRKVSEYFRQIGKDRVAIYIDCLTGDEKDVWVPMEKDLP